MEAGDWAAVIVSVASAVLVLGVLVVLVSLNRTMGTLRRAVEEMRRETLPLMSGAHDTLRQASAELERVDQLLGTAESVSTTVDSASRLAYLAFSNPVVKVLALGAGTARAARRLRKSD